ncbi:MAG TPA: host attachment protein [Rhizomicrobium sp.]|nr:host attachment protein [Rhizomicrobium sp.]
MKFALRQGTWVAVCDGRKAVLFENEGNHVHPKLRMIETLAHDDRPTHELGSSAPGRTFSAAHGRHAAVQDTDLQDEAERRFLRDFAALLDRLVRERKPVSLILAAPARALGIIRPHLSEGTRAVLKAELVRDLVKLPGYEIERRLKDLRS